METRTLDHCKESLLNIKACPHIRKIKPQSHCICVALKTSSEETHDDEKRMIWNVQKSFLYLCSHICTLNLYTHNI